MDEIKMRDSTELHVRGILSSRKQEIAPLFNKINIALEKISLPSESVKEIKALIGELVIEVGKQSYNEAGRICFDIVSESGDLTLAASIAEAMDL